MPFLFRDTDAAEFFACYCKELEMMTDRDAIARVSTAPFQSRSAMENLHPWVGT